MLRQLTLDLYGRIPTIDEYQALAARPALDAAAIDAMFTTDEFFVGARAYFRHLIWGGLPDDLAVVGNQRTVTRQATTNLWFAGNLRGTFRGRVDVVCLDQPQTQFDAAGRPVPISTFADATCTGGTCRQEGYVMVTPYWATAPIKVCAFDAQALATGTGATPPTCGPYTINAGCGCGAGLRYCLPGTGDPNHAAVRAALADEAPRIFESVVREHGSYFDAFTTQRSFVNGPLAHFYADLSGPGVALRQAGAVGYDGRMSATLPALAFADRDTWVPIERDAVHAGANSTPVSTRRARKGTSAAIIRARIAASSRASIAAWNRARTAVTAAVAGSTTVGGDVDVGGGARAQPTRSASSAARRRVAGSMRGV